MRYRHKALPVAAPRHARFGRAKQLPWIFLGMLFVAAAFLSSPALGGINQYDPVPSRDLGTVSHTP